jgi:hypothetical protein
VLTRDIQASAAQVLRIEADGVEVDLNGRTIRLDGTGTGVWIGGNVSTFTLRGGRIVGAATGIAYAAGTRRARLRMEDVEIVAPTGVGVLLEGPASVELRGVRVSGAALDGIRIAGAGGPFQGRLVDSSVEDCGGTGVALHGMRGGEIRGNTISGCTGPGLTLSAEAGWNAGGNLIEGNTLRGAGAASPGLDIGLWVNHNLVLRNVVTGHLTHGIVVASTGNRVAENESGANLGDGLRLDGAHNLAERNTLTGNGFGIRVPCNGSRYRDNMLMGNTTLYCTGSCCSTGNAGGNLQ